MKISESDLIDAIVTAAFKNQNNVEHYTVEDLAHFIHDNIFTKCSNPKITTNHIVDDMLHLDDLSANTELLKHLPFNEEMVLVTLDRGLYIFRATDKGYLLEVKYTKQSFAERVKLFINSTLFMHVVADKLGISRAVFSRLLAFHGINPSDIVFEYRYGVLLDKLLDEKGMT